jgi:hypothetical protein
METSVLSSFFRLCGLIVVVVIIILLGWNEPLKNRFQKPVEVVPVEPTPAPVPERGNWMWEKHSNPLDSRPKGSR